MVDALVVALTLALLVIDPELPLVLETGQETVQGIAVVKGKSSTLLADAKAGT